MDMLENGRQQVVDALSALLAAKSACAVIAAASETDDSASGHGKNLAYDSGFG